MKHFDGEKKFSNLKLGKELESLIFFCFFLKMVNLETQFVCTSTFFCLSLSLLMSFAALQYFKKYYKERGEQFNINNCNYSIIIKRKRNHIDHHRFPRFFYYLFFFAVVVFSFSNAVIYFLKRSYLNYQQTNE